jgi:prepilin-type N-terminal cleavage/methylation domain-containing protein
LNKRSLFFIKTKSARGFTLVELLVVIAIIAILAAVVILIVNPLEVTRRARDATRLGDLANVQQAINVTVQESTQSGSTVLCNGGSAPCVGRTTDAGAQGSSGGGWIKVNLTLQNAVQVPNLPVDPQNTTTNHYTYCSNGTAWEINTRLESAQQTDDAGLDKDGKDGGDDITVYETGSDPGLDLISPSGGSCTF